MPNGYTYFICIHVSNIGDIIQDWPNLNSQICPLFTLWPIYENCVVMFPLLHIYTPQKKLRILFFWGVFFIIRDLSLQFNKKYPQKK